MKNILVIGGSYFVGKVFVEELRKSGDYAIYVLNRGNRPLKMEGLTEVVCDRHNAAELQKVLPRVRWHAIVDFCAYEPADIEVTLQSIEGSVEQYIYISTATVYQDSLTLPMNECTPKVTGPSAGPSGDYAYKKWLTEIRLEELCKSKGIGYVSLRPAFIYGKYNYAPRETYFFNLVAQDKPIIIPNPPQALFSMVSVWDMARICIACLGNEKVFDNAYTVCCDELVSYDRLVEVLGLITSKRLDIRRQPLSLINVRGGSLPFPLQEHLVYSGSVIERTLNYQFMTIEEGMRRTYDWYSKSGN